MTTNRLNPNVNHFVKQAESFEREHVAELFIENNEPALDR